MATSNIPTSVGSRPQRPMRPAMRRIPAMRPRNRQRSPFIRIAPVIILVVSLLLPAEVRLNFSGQTIYAYRMAWMLLAPWLLYQMLGGRFQFRLNDAIVGFAAVWMVLSFSVVDGFAKGIPAGLSLALDVLIPYLTVRLTIRTFDDFRCLLLFLAPIALFLGAMLALESFTHVRYFRSGAQAIFGSLGAAEYGSAGSIDDGREIDVRFGLARAMGPFSHPILAGVFFAGLLPLYHFSGLRGWPKLVGMLAGMAAVFSLSSAAFVGIAIFVGLAFYDALRKVVTFLNWQIFIIMFGALMLVLQLVAQNGLLSVIIRYTINPSTGYYRLLIWEYGSKMVEANPVFGSAYAPFQGLHWMNNSVDTVWLALAIRHGLPVALLLGFAVLYAITKLAIAASRDQSINNPLYIGLAIALVIFFILGFTVSFFGGLLIWFVMLLGIGTTFGTLSPPKKLKERKLIARRQAAIPETKS